MQGVSSSNLLLPTIKKLTDSKVIFAPQESGVTLNLEAKLKKQIAVFIYCVLRQVKRRFSMDMAGVLMTICIPLFSVIIFFGWLETRPHKTAKQA